MKGTEKQIKWAQDIIDRGIKRIQDDAAWFAANFPDFVDEGTEEATEKCVAVLRAIAESDFPAERIIYNRLKIDNPENGNYDLQSYFATFHYDLKSCKMYLM